MSSVIVSHANMSFGYIIFDGALITPLLAYEQAPSRVYSGRWLQSILNLNKLVEIASRLLY